MTDARPIVSAQTPESRAADWRAFREAELVRSLDHRATVIGRIRQRVAEGVARRPGESWTAHERRGHSRAVALECEISREIDGRIADARELSDLRARIAAAANPPTPTPEITP